MAASTHVPYSYNPPSLLGPEPHNFSIQGHTQVLPLFEPRWSVSSIDSVDDVAELRLRPFVCPFLDCAQRFKRKYTLKDHVKSHTGEKPFVCPVRACRKTFTTSGNLSRHKRLHPWLDAPLQCLVDGCGCAFPSEEKLERHMLTHFGEASVHCCEVAECGRVFSTPGNLRRHMRQSHETHRWSDQRRPLQSSSRVNSPTVIRVGIPPRLATVISTKRPVSSVMPSACRSGPHTHDRLPSDEELLETLACLFDDDDRVTKDYATPAVLTVDSVIY